MAYKRMKEKGCSAADLEEMKRALICDGWEDHHKLPKDWTTRLICSGNGFKKRIFLSENGVVFQDLKSAIKCCR